MARKTTLPNYQLEIKRWIEDGAKWHWSLIDMHCGGVSVAHDGPYDTPEEAAIDGDIVARLFAKMTARQKLQLFAYGGKKSLILGKVYAAAETESA